jgi:hypothetical protein
MKVFPFYEVARNAEQKMEKGFTINQQFVCKWCGTKQTMDRPNVFFEKGRCEECGRITDLRLAGCNFMASTRR